MADTRRSTRGRFGNRLAEMASWKAGWRICLVVLGVAALLLAAVGYWDLVRARGIAARTTGAVLLTFALLALAAIAAAWSPTRASRWREGAIAAGPLLIISSWIVGTVFPAEQRHLVVTIVVAAIVAAVALFTLLIAWHFGHRSSAAAGNGKGPGIRRGEWIAAVATLLAALFAVPLAWYSAYYLPRHTVPAVSIKVELGDMTVHGTHGAVTATITVENTSDTSVRLIGTMYQVSGVAVSDATKTAAGQLDSARIDAATRKNYGPGARYNATTQMAPPELIQFGQIVLDQATLVPGESTEASVVVFFSAKSFHVLRVGADLVIARDDRVEIGSPRSDPAGIPVSGSGDLCAGRRVLVNTWPIQRGSTVEKLTQVDHEVVLGRVIRDDVDNDGTWWPSVPYLAYQVQRKGNPCDHLFDKVGGLEDNTMAGEAGAMTERLIPANLALPTR